MTKERAYGTKGEFNKVLRPKHTRGFASGACSAPGSFCTCQYTRGSVFKFAQFSPGVCSQIFNRLNIVEHFSGLKFCSRGWSIPMKSLANTEELCSRSVPLEHTPGTKSLVCIGLGKKAQSRGPTPYTRFYIPLLREKIIIVHFITAIFKSQNSAYFSTKLILICSQSAEKWKRFRMMRFRTDVIKSKKQCNLWINHTAKCQSACREITSDFKMDVIKGKI